MPLWQGHSPGLRLASPVFTLAASTLFGWMPHCPQFLFQRLTTDHSCVDQSYCRSLSMFFLLAAQFEGITITTCSNFISLREKQTFVWKINWNFWLLSYKQFNIILHLLLCQFLSDRDSYLLLQWFFCQILSAQLVIHESAQTIEFLVGFKYKLTIVKLAISVVIFLFRCFITCA